MEKTLSHKNICPYYEENCINVGCVCPKFLAYGKVSISGEVEKQLLKMNIDTKKDMLHIMFDIQKHFSSRFFNLEQMAEKDLSAWIKQYDTCIHDEITEVHEHLEVFENIYGNKQNDILELKKELIDILHFVLDMFIVGKASASILIDKYLDLFNIEKSNENKSFYFLFENEKVEIKKINNIMIDNHSIDSISLLILTGHIMVGLRKIRQQIDWKHWKKWKSNIDFDKLHNAFVFLFSSLIKCFVFLGIEVEEVYNIYVSKNVENIFRQEFGY